MPELTIEDLLRPITVDHPAGSDLRYTGIYEQIKEARREDDGLTQGAWQHERKAADYRTVVKIATKALCEQTKDLQIAAWLTEALLHERGFAGLRSGLELCAGLVEHFWDTLYPVLEDGDAELRAAPLSWMGSKLEPPLKSVSLVQAGHDWFAYKQSRTVGYENSSATPEQKKARERAVNEGQLTAEAFDKEWETTPRNFYVQAGMELAASLAQIESLQTICGRRFGDSAPGFSRLREALVEVQHTVRALLQKKGLPEEPAEPAAVAVPVAIEPAIESAAESVHTYLNEESVSNIFSDAMQAVRSGQFHQALQLLNRDAASQRSGRSRFLRKLELARVCIAAGKDAIAQPLLEDLAAMIDAHKLDEWEDHETVAGALVTILQASKRLQSDAKEKQVLFERICRLDPSQALGCQI